MASKPTPAPYPNQRHRFTVEFSTRDGMTPAETTEWVQKFFDFFHPNLKARVLGKPEVLIETPTMDEVVQAVVRVSHAEMKPDALYVTGSGEPPTLSVGIEEDLC